MSTVAIGSDHRGFPLKAFLSKHLASVGILVRDLGCQGETEKVDYPDYAALVCQDVVSGRADWGILICGSGLGMSMAANKFRGIRAALCRDAKAGQMAREHNNANVLVLAADETPEEEARQIVTHWMNASFQAGRHQTRIEKMMGIEEQECRC